jgi:hypothetical protein
VSKDPVLMAFLSLALPLPPDEYTCIYKSGLADSADLMQLLLEIELVTNKRIDLSALIDGEVSVMRLREALNGAK